MAHVELKAARLLLESWAKWFETGGGYASRSSIERFNDGWGIASGGVFGSEIPSGVEPRGEVKLACQAIRYMSEESTPLVEILYAKYRKTRPVENIERPKVITAERRFFIIYSSLEQ